MDIRSVWKVLCVVLILSFGAIAGADDVTPSDRVTTRLRVRAQPIGDSTVVGFLQPGQFRPLTGQVSGWYEIEFDSGTRGFVSKSWSTVISGASTQPLAPVQVRIGSWNIRKLGHGDSKDFEKVARVINNHFDVLAVVEVMQKGGGRPGYDLLRTQLGPDWDGLVTDSPRPDSASGSAEYYAVFIRKSRARWCAGWSELRFQADNSGSDDSTGNDFFSREPAFTCVVTLNANGVMAFDFMLAAYHAVWGEGDIGDIQDEVAHLDTVFESMAAAQPGERDLIIAGDFNLVSTDLAEVVSVPVRTLGPGSTLNGSGYLTTNLYDHILVKDLLATNEMTGSDQVVDVRSVALSHKEFFRTVSDHLPVVARFSVQNDDD